MKNLIQIAGIIDQQEADMLMDAGVDWMGFPLRLPIHKEDISAGEAAKIIKSFSPSHLGVLITYLNHSQEIYQLCQTLGVQTVQLHGDISISEIQYLRELAPQIFLIKSLIVRDENVSELEKQIIQFRDDVDAFITDTHDPETGADGATGKCHDWDISRRLVTISPKPVILAGGLNPGNVLQAILHVQPAGVDTHTGVENESGRKCQTKVEKFIKEARLGFAKLETSFIN